MSKLLDVARGAFSRLSPGARMRLGRVLKYVPTDLQYGSTYRDWRRRIEQARTDPGGMAAYRDQARIEIVASVWNTAPYYRETLERAFGSGFDPASVVDDAVWQAIPVLEGPTVHVESPRMCVVPASRLDLTSTGGSSGQPVKFFIDRHRSPIEIAFLHDAWSVAGYRTGDARAVFRGFEIDETGERSFVFDPGLNELRCSVFRLTDPVMQGFHDAILARGIRLLQGYPSAMAIFASYLLRSGQAPMRDITGIITMSEPMRDAYRAILAEAFPDAVLSLSYGLTEKVAFAVSDPTGPEVYRFNPLYGYTEMVDDGGSPITEPGRSGRIVSTGLIFRGMPLLRYDTGDTAELIEVASAENGWRMAVGRITPKQGNEWLVGRTGVLISLIGALQISKEMNTIREFQFFQDTPGLAVLRVAPLDGVAPDFTDYRERFERKAAGELTLRVDIVDAIPVTMRGKRKFIDQRLDLAAASRAAGLAYRLTEIEPA